jgi:rfaE bifunctional protein nucleotidyltransferase chain/domain
MAKTYTDLHELARQLRACQRDGQRVVLANGCFDVIHGGHVSYLEDARACGDVLVVGLNSDPSVRRLKGQGRPVCNEGERLTVLEALRCVDYIIVFEEDTCENLLRVLRPDVHAKGTDYTAEGVPERAISDELGIRTVITGNPKENATKTMIRKVAGDDKAGKPRDTVPVVKISGDEIAGESIVAMRRAARRFARRLYATPVINRETGFSIRISGKSLSHAFNNPGVQHIQAVAALPDLLRHGIKVASNVHRRGSPDVMQVHTFVAPLQIGDVFYRMKMTVFEYRCGDKAAEEKKLHDHVGEQIERPGGYAQTTSREEKLGAVPAPGLTYMNIRDLLAEVKGKERPAQPGLDVPSITGHELDKPAVMPEGMSPASPLPDSGTAGLTVLSLRQENAEVKGKERSPMPPTDLSR